MNSTPLRDNEELTLLCRCRYWEDLHDLVTEIDSSDRLDVLMSLDGVDPELAVLASSEERGCLQVCH